MIIGNIFHAVKGENKIFLFPCPSAKEITARDPEILSGSLAV
jgi:hypothetical protein